MAVDAPPHAPARSSRPLAAATLSLLLAGCASPTTSTTTARPSMTTASPPSTAESSAPPPIADAPDAAIEAPPVVPRGLDAPSELVSLDVPGFAPAVVHLPLGATSRRPLLVATHGNYDRPDWHCETWGAIVRARAFVLCPRGIPRRDSPAKDDVRFEYASNAALEKELDAGVDALVARFPDLVDRDRAVYTGFSLGAIMGTAIAARHPERWPRLVLIEGGQDKLTASAAKAFARGGGARVLFGCGQAGCILSANASAKNVERAGLAARVVSGDPREGHTYGGAVGREIARAFDWVVEDDPRWAGGA